LTFRHEYERLRRQELAHRGLAWDLRLGLHLGTVVAGVVGRRRFAYDIWGDTVNTAKRPESAAELGTLNVSAAVVRAVEPYVSLTAHSENAMDAATE
jgi:class 3 adenylate cyclase